MLALPAPRLLPGQVPAPIDSRRHRASIGHPPWLEANTRNDFSETRFPALRPEPVNGVRRRVLRLRLSPAPVIDLHRQLLCALDPRRRFAPPLALGPLQLHGLDDQD